MPDHPDRRRVLQLSLLAAMPSLLQLGDPGSALAAAGDTGPAHDFDFFLGTWNVRHRRLKQRLANSNEWEEFDGTTKCQSLLGGIANLNESISHRGGNTSRGMGIRAFDAKTGNWADWYFSASDPLKIEAPGLGRFENGIGTFLSDDTFGGRPVKVRGVFSHSAPDQAQWEQAFSPDGGRTWETNWVMRYTRTA